MPVKVTKSGKMFEIDDSEDSLNAARAKGYKPLITVTKNGKDTFDLDADDTESVRAAFNKGYSQVDAFQNLEKSKKSSQKDIGMIESLGQGIASTATFGFDDELSAALAPGKYDDNIKTIRRMKSDREEANPGSNLAGNIVGGAVLPGLGAAKAATTLGRIKTGAAIGAAQGGVQGVGDSESEDFAGMAKDAAAGAALGGTIGAVTGGLIKPRASADEVVSAGKNSVRTIAPASEAGKRGFKEGAKNAKDIPILGDLPVIGSGPAQAIGGAIGAAREILDQKKAMKELSEAAGQPWPGSKDNWSDATTIVEKAIRGGEFNNATDYIATQAAAFGIDVNDYKKLLKMSPERLEQLANFDKREAAEDVAPLLQNFSDTFQRVRTTRLGELKKTARAEFKTDVPKVLKDLEEAYFNADELVTTKGAKKTIIDAYDILNGKGAGVYGFAPGRIQEVGMDTMFDRIQAARSHLDDSIDWAAIKKGNRSPNPAEKTLMKVRESLDNSLKGGSDSKIESDALFRKSKELEDRFLKLVSDKDGVHEVSLAKIYDNDDRRVRAKIFLKEVEDFSGRTDLPDELRKSTKALADALKEGMQTAEDRRLFQSFKMASGGPSRGAIEKASSIMRGDGPAVDAILRPGQFLDLKAQANALAKESFQKPFSELNEKERRVLVEYLSWQRTQAIAQKPIRPQEAAAKWQELLSKE